jgi:hypothetical protein
MGDRNDWMITAANSDKTAIDETTYVKCLVN